MSQQEQQALVPCVQLGTRRRLPRSASSGELLELDCRLRARSADRSSEPYQVLGPRPRVGPGWLDSAPDCSALARIEDQSPAPSHTSARLARDVRQNLGPLRCWLQALRLRGRRHQESPILESQLLICHPGYDRERFCKKRATEAGFALASRPPSLQWRKR